MRTIYFVLLVIYSGTFYGQEQVKKEKPELEVMFHIRAQMLYPIQFGNTALNKAHDAKVGLSTQMNLLKFQDFRAGVGFDFVTYSITDKQLIANLGESKYTSAYLLLSYEYKATKKITLIPNIGYGACSLELGHRTSRFGKQNGSEFRIGGILDYKIGRSSSLFGGIAYVNNKFDVETSPEYKSFFSKANQLQLDLGIRFGD